MLTVFSFLTAIAILVAVHEWGHYRMARACGVKVLEFSVGFGPRLVQWVSKQSGTRYAVAMIPLGGFVKMLDEREGNVEPGELSLAFNRKPLWARTAVVAAGPLANLVLAVLLFSLVHWMGVQETRARIAAPATGSMAASAGLASGHTIEAVSYPQEEPVAVQSFEDFAVRLVHAAMEGKDLEVHYRADPDGPQRSTVLKLSTRGAASADGDLLGQIGFTGPWTEAVLGKLLPDGAALAAGLAVGDRVLRVNDQVVTDATQLREWIRQSGINQAPAPQDWLVQRNGAELHLTVTPKQEHDGTQTVGRVGAILGAPPEAVEVRYGGLDGLVKAVDKTWDSSLMTLRIMGKMLIGEASLKNLSGPITIADYSGRSAAVGFVTWLSFLALVSISLGVLNLLPLPVLDGGHLMYYLWEGVTGKSVSDAWMARLQRVGLAIIFLMMSVAIFNDVQRLLS